MFEKKSSEGRVESPQGRGRSLAAKQSREAKKIAMPAEKWYELHGDKVCEVTKKKNGNNSSRYMFSAKKYPKELVKLKKEGKICMGKKADFMA